MLLNYTLSKYASRGFVPFIAKLFKTRNSIDMDMWCMFAPMGSTMRSSMRTTRTNSWTHTKLRRPGPRSLQSFAGIKFTSTSQWMMHGVLQAKRPSQCGGSTSTKATPGIRTTGVA